MADGETTRRAVLGGAALGLGAMAAPAGAQPGQRTSAVAPRDPQTKFASDPFPEQRQPWPGLASRMTPRPDHGEASYRGSGRLAGRRAFVTGGDSGIGRAAAIAFAREGADVAINYHPDEEPDAREVADLIRQAGRKAATLPGDIRSERVCQGLIADAVRQLGGIDILVNNAAYQQSKASIAEITSEQFDRTMKTNVYAMFWFCKAAIPGMAPGGVIINTASVNAFDPGEELIDYAATKAAIHIFSKGLAKQVAKQGIRVNVVAPGPIWTPLQVVGGQLPGKMGEFGQDTPLGRAGQPAELAALYVTLASEEASFTTGSTFGAHGGGGIPKNPLSP